MNGIDVIRQTATTTHMVVGAYLGDLEDADLMKRPAEGCNHIAWQVGHLIAAECDMLNELRAGSAPELPAGFVATHSTDNVASDDSAAFLSKDAYMELWQQVQAATGNLLDSLSDEDLDAEAPEKYRKFFPTVGSILILIATHPMMHAGQWVPVRRDLGKPVVI